MSITITARQARPGDIIRDRDGNLWTRRDHNVGQVFALVHVFKHVSDSILPPGQDDVEAEVLDLLGPLTLVSRGGEPVGDELPPEPAPPRIVEFEWGFHSNAWENRDSLAHELGFTPSDELLEKMGNPFYEVIVRFSLDTETGKTTVLGAK